MRFTGLDLSSMLNLLFLALNALSPKDREENRIRFSQLSLLLIFILFAVSITELPAKLARSTSPSSEVAFVILLPSDISLFIPAPFQSIIFAPLANGVHWIFDLFLLEYIVMSFIFLLIPQIRDWYIRFNQYLEHLKIIPSLFIIVVLSALPSFYNIFLNDTLTRTVLFSVYILFPYILFFYIFTFISKPQIHSLYSWEINHPFVSAVTKFRYAVYYSKENGRDTLPPSKLGVTIEKHLADLEYSQTYLLSKAESLSMEKEYEKKARILFKKWNKLNRVAKAAIIQPTPELQLYLLHLVENKKINWENTDINGMHKLFWEAFLPILISSIISILVMLLSKTASIS